MRKSVFAVLMSFAVSLAPFLPVAIVTPLAVSQAGCSATWIQTALNDLPILVQIATSIAGIVSAAQGQGAVDQNVAAQIQAISGQVKSDLQLVQNLVTSYQSASTTARPGLLSQIDSALGAVQTNLNALLLAFHVSSPSLQAAIVASVGLAITTVLAIQSLVPAPPAANAARVARSASPVRPMSASQLRSSFNAIVSSNGYGQFVI